MTTLIVASSIFLVWIGYLGFKEKKGAKHGR